MKTKLLLLLLMLTVAVSAMASCFSGGGPSGEGKEEENLIYNSTSELYLITSPDLENDFVGEINAQLDYSREDYVRLAAFNSEPHRHEIVLGVTDREISKTALQRLERIDKNDDNEYRFVIYSDGSSVAVVWEENEIDPGVMANIALEYFLENYCSEKLVAAAGNLYSAAVNVVDDYYRPLDAEKSLASWDTFAERYGEELAASFKQLYAIYSPDCITWLANLYDPDICVCVDLYGEETCSGTKYCGTGGFYFSNSARDTLGYLPDVESTHQALNFLTSSGLAGSYLSIITEDMKKQIGDFVYALEEPNGYFYHPQWGIEFTDTKITRRSRDLGWATSILSVLGRTPKYTTASGVKGENARGTASLLTERLGSSVSAVSRVILTSDDAYAAHLQDLESFKKYLASKDLRNESYGVGSEIGSQTSQIKARDKQIGTPDNPTPLMDYLIDWLNAGQNPETGNWDWKKPGDEGYRDYHGTNGLLKIIGIYTEHGVEMPYAKEAAMSAMADIINPAQVNQVVELYNTWFAIKQINSNLNECGGAEGAAKVAEIRSSLMSIAPEAIIVSRDKISGFLKLDGSASYDLTRSSATAQGCPSAVPNTNEGDVNGSTIAINGIIGNIASALGISKPNLFGSTEKYLFKKTIAELSPITKVDDSPKPEAFDFEYDKIGAAPEDITLLDGNGGTTVVVADPTGRGSGNVLQVISGKNSGDTIKVPVQNSSGLAKSYVFEGDFCINEASSDYLLQLSIDACYLITFRQVVDEKDPDYGRIRLVESSSATGNVSIDRYLGITVDKGQWFKIKMEYYLGTEDEVRIKIYADTDLTDDSDCKLYAISDNYRNESGAKVTTGSATPGKSFYISQIYVMKSASLEMYVDNIGCYVSKTEYSSILQDGDKPYFNIDAPGNPRVEYSFDDGEIPDDLTVNSPDEAVSVKDGALSINGSASVSTVTAPINIVGPVAKCAIAEFDITCTSATVGKDVLLINGMEGKTQVFGMLLKCMEDTDGMYLTICPRNESSVDSPVGGVKIPVDTKVNLRFEYYHLEDVVLVYVNGQFTGASVKLYSEGNRRTVDALCFSTYKDSTAEVLIDGLTFEMAPNLFVDAVAPEKPEKLYGFETQESEVTVSGVGTGVQSHDGDKALVMNSSRGKGAISLPVNVRSNVINAQIISMRLDYLSFPTGGDMQAITLSDSFGNALVSFVLGYAEGRVGLYEVGKGGRLSTPLYTYDKSKTVELDVEVYGESGMVHILVNGAVVAKSSVILGEEYLDNAAATLTVESLSAASTVAIDDVKCESLYKVYKVVKLPQGVNGEADPSVGLTFDKSSSGNLPSSVYTLTYGDNYVGIRNMYNGITEEYSNVLEINKLGAGNDELAFTAGEDISGTGAVVFEADIKLDVTTNGCAYRIYFGADKKGTDPMYLLQLSRNSSNQVYLEDISTASDGAISNYYATDVKVGEWFKLRVELVAGDRNTVSFRIFVDGVMIVESHNFAGSQKPDAEVKPLPKSVKLYAMGATRGSLFIDNLSISALEE